MKGQPRKRKAIYSSSKHCAAEGFRVFVLLNQNSRIQASTNSHMVMATPPRGEIPMPPSRRTTLCAPRTKALPREKLWPSANQDSWGLKRKIFGAKRLIELRSINSWRDMLGSTSLIHQTPKACPILNFLLGDLPSCQIQLLNTLNLGRVYKEQI